MIILSIDVGIKNLSYCLINIESTRPLKWNLLEWNNVNIKHNLNDLNYIKLDYKKWKISELIECIKYHKLVLPDKKSKQNLHKTISDFLKEKKVKSTKSVDLNTIVLNVADYFDKKFDKLICDTIIIENQPVLKNPIMKTMQMIVFTYFCLRKEKISVKCVSAGLKMKFCVSADLIDTIPKGYKNTKQTSINVVNNLFEDNLPDFWIKSKKKDDLSDVIIQAFAYCDKLA